MSFSEATPVVDYRVEDMLGRRTFEDFYYPAWAPQNLELGELYDIANYGVHERMAHWVESLEPELVMAEHGNDVWRFLREHNPGKDVWRMQTHEDWDFNCLHWLITAVDLWAEALNAHCEDYFTFILPQGEG